MSDQLRMVLAAGLVNRDTTRVGDMELVWGREHPTAILVVNSVVRDMERFPDVGFPAYLRHGRCAWVMAFTLPEAEDWDIEDAGDLDVLSDRWAEAGNELYAAWCKHVAGAWRGLANLEMFEGGAIRWYHNLRWHICGGNQIDPLTDNQRAAIHQTLVTRRDNWELDARNLCAYIGRSWASTVAQLETEAVSDA